MVCSSACRRLSVSASAAAHRLDVLLTRSASDRVASFEEFALAEGRSDSAQAVLADALQEELRARSEAELKVELR